VVLQSPLFGQGVSLPVCTITSSEVPASLLRIALPVDPASGLQHPSWAMVDGITTIRQRRLGRRIGHLDDATMLAIGRALMVFLGLA
jgi:mRNA interferase MazF